MNETKLRAAHTIRQGDIRIVNAEKIVGLAKLWTGMRQEDALICEDTAAFIHPVTRAKIVCPPGTFIEVGRRADWA